MFCWVGRQSQMSHLKEQLRAMIIYVLCVLFLSPISFNFFVEVYTNILTTYISIVFHNTWHTRILLFLYMLCKYSITMYFLKWWIPSIFVVGPEVLPFAFPADVLEGQLLQVSCIATTGDEPMTLNWYKDSQVLVSSPQFLINKLSHKMSLLILSDVGFEHSGIYSCDAANAAGKATVRAELRVKGMTSTSSYLIKAVLCIVWYFFRKSICEQCIVLEITEWVNWICNEKLYPLYEIFFGFPVLWVEFFVCLC